jgi:hypothetical protein
MRKLLAVGLLVTAVAGFVVFVATRPWTSSALPPACAVLTEKRAAPLVGFTDESQDSMVTDAKETYCRRSGEGIVSLTATRLDGADSSVAFSSLVGNPSPVGPLGGVPAKDVPGLGAEAALRTATQGDEGTLTLAVRQGRFAVLISATARKPVPQITQWARELARVYLKEIG